MSKGKQVPVNKVANKIPVLAFGRNGVFETAKNFYTEMYAVELVKIQMQRFLSTELTSFI